jgi:hypothetical protein
VWLSHHADEQLDRCVLVAGRPVCRRCVLLYPLALATAALTLVTDSTVDHPWMLLVLPLPAVIEWWLEHLGRVSYSPNRQLLVTAPLAVALGRGFARYLESPADPLFWLMVVVYGGSCAAIALWRFLDERAL